MYTVYFVHLCKLVNKLLDTADVVSNDMFWGIIHYKCILVCGVPSGHHCLIKLVLHSINWQYNIIPHPGYISSRWVCWGAGEGEVCGWTCTLETGNCGATVYVTKEYCTNRLKVVHTKCSNGFSFVFLYRLVFCVILSLFGINLFRFNSGSLYS